MDIKINGQTLEGFVAYLRRVGEDYAESGYEATAEDYETAAETILTLIELVADRDRTIFNLKGTLHYVEQLTHNAGRGGSK